MAETFGPPEFDPDDYDTVESIAEVAAPIFALHGWAYGVGGADGVPDPKRIAEVIRCHYERHAEEPLYLSSSGRFVLVDENPHDGTPVLHDGIRVFLDLGELPPVRGDQLDDESTPSGVGQGRQAPAEPTEGGRP